MKKQIKQIGRIVLHGRDWLLFPFMYPPSVRRFKSLHEGTTAISERFHIPFKYRGMGEFVSIAPKQVMPEITELYRTVTDLKPKTVLEIGTFKGGTLYMWCQAAADDATVVAVDYPMGEWTHPFSWRRRFFYRHFAKSPGQHLHFIGADSHAPSTLERVKAALRGRQVDFLFIDGDHSYAGVKQDFEMYAPLVAKGGVIAFHDIQVRPQLPQIQVYKFWREIKDQYRSREVIAQEGGMANLIGIGIIQL